MGLFLLLSVLKSVACSLCRPMIARESYACCMMTNTIANKEITNCSLSTRQGECSSGENLAIEPFPPELNCSQQFTGLKVRNWIGHYCNGGGIWEPDDEVVEILEDQSKIEEYPSTYDNNTYLWSCSKPPPAKKQATVILDPPPGNISTTSNEMILINVT